MMPRLPLVEEKYQIATALHSHNAKASADQVDKKCG